MNAQKNSRSKVVGTRDPRSLRPTEFMRARHPELFPDTEIVHEPRLGREVFEYQLETLTTRKQEAEFENFCRRLCEREICPNLIPQTGPTGGGDGKVDTETYPVADELSLRWYEGSGTQASNERWAFAFSAKQDWRSKASSDTQKIAMTKRGYKLIYFVTNQPVKAKTRTEVEKELTKRVRIPVRILDRTWILKCVFENDRLQLAIETLGLTEYDRATRRIPGPRDVEREAQLDELERQISDPARYRGVEYQLGEDCLRAALLSRGLGRPRAEVDGKLARAERIAERVGHPQQQLRIAYNKAWTAYWWFEDFQEFTRVYDKVEELAISSNQATDLELLTNLWTALSASVKAGHLDLGVSKVEQRTVTLKRALERLADDSARPNNALWARTNRLLMDLQEAIPNRKQLEVVLKEFKVILAKSKGLVAYPVDTVSRIVRELRTLIGDSSECDELIEDVTRITQQRVSEGEAGRVLSEHGFQKLRYGKMYDAVRLLGRAQQKLAMHECRPDLIAALFGCGIAYQSAGLLWAARSNVLAAANQALADFTEYGRVVPQALTCLQKLVWLELQLGRVPCILQWIEAASVVAGHLAMDEKSKEEYLEEREAQDSALAILLLKAELSDLKSAEFLPDILDKLGLTYSWFALLFALGHEDYLRSEGAIPETETQEATRQLFLQWLNQPISKDLAQRPEFLAAGRVELHSCVLGCDIVADSENRLESFSLSEWILAALEALLSTSLEGDVMPYTTEFRINLCASEAASDPRPEYEFDDATQTLTIRHSLNVRPANRAQGDSKWFGRLVLEIVCRIAAIRDLESYARKVFGAEDGLSRAFNFSDPAIPVENLLGVAPKVRLPDWEAWSDGKRYSLRRSSRWNDGLATEESKQSDLRGLKLGEGPPPPELLDWSRATHRDQRVFSLINIALWDRAGWRALVYLLDPELDRPPLLALGFTDPETARSIFKGWLGKLGRVDIDDRLRLSIVTGVDKRHPHSYKAVIGMNPKFPSEDFAGRRLVLVSRICQMDPPDSKNLDGFLGRFKRVGRYFLLPASWPQDTEQPEVFFDLAIGKRELRVCPAWQLSENDPDAIAIEPDDDPIVPDDVKDAPVLRVLRKRRATHA